MSIKQAIQVIEKNSKYTFFYKADLSNAKIRDIHCEGSIEEVLNVLFKDSGISYVIKDNEVILKSTPVVVATPQQSNKIVVKAISGILWVNRSLELPLWRKIMLKMVLSVI